VVTTDRPNPLFDHACAFDFITKKWNSSEPPMDRYYNEIIHFFLNNDKKI
jgi:hypothetical protein